MLLATYDTGWSVGRHGKTFLFVFVLVALTLACCLHTIVVFFFVLFCFSVGAVTTCCGVHTSISYDTYNPTDLCSRDGRMPCFEDLLLFVWFLP